MNRIADQRPSVNRKPAGRKPYYSSQQLMDVWLDVQMGMESTGLSALQFCKRRSFFWIEGGRVLPRENATRKTGQSVVHHVAHGETLRRGYQQAVAFLQAESEPYRRLWEMGARSEAFGPISPTEEWWRRELKAALARR